MPKRPMPRLGDLERDVMDRLWDADSPRTVREVYDDLAAERDLAYTTVMTVLDRLAHKRMVSRSRDGRAYRYRPTHTRAELTAELMHEALSMDRLDKNAALVHFADRVTADEAAALQEALARIREEQEPT